MKTVLCFGDSNTWGWDASTQTRFARNVRWPGALQGLLGDGVYVIEEGLGGRMTVWDDPIDEFHSGKTYLRPCLNSHKPLEVVVLLLGTNDFKARIGVSALDIAAGAALLVRMIQQSGCGPQGGAPQALLLCPPVLGAMVGDTAALFAGGYEKSLQLDAEMQKVARLEGCAYLNTGTLIASDPLDGVHLTADAHSRLAAAVAERVRTMLI